MLSTKHQNSKGISFEEIKELLSVLNKKIDMLIETRENLTLMILAEKPLREFLEKEPEIYSTEDIKVGYR